MTMPTVPEVGTEQAPERKRNRVRLYVILGAAAAAAIAAVLVVVFVVLSPGPVKVRGLITTTETFSLDGPSGGCGISGGDQVRITDPAGTVLASPDLSLGYTQNFGPVVGLESFYSFSATVPAESRYGIAIGQHPVYYVSEQDFVKGVHLSC